MLLSSQSTYGHFNHCLFLYGVVPAGAAGLLAAGDAGAARPQRQRLGPQVRAVHHRSRRQRRHPAVLYPAHRGGSQEARVSHAAVDDRDGHPDGDLLHHVPDRHQPYPAGLGRDAGGGSDRHCRTSCEGLCISLLHSGGPQPAQADHVRGRRAPLPALRPSVRAGADEGTGLLTSNFMAHRLWHSSNLPTVPSIKTSRQHS